MKKTVIAIAVALAGFSTIIAQAAPKDNTWYAGAKLGCSQFHDTGWYNSVMNNDGPTHKNQLGVGTFGAYQANPYTGLEIGHDWLGRMPYKGETVNGAFKAQGVHLTAKLNYPLSDILDVYTRLGGMVWRANSSNAIAGEEHDTGVSSLFATGVEWAIANNISTRLEYQWVNNIGERKTVGVRPNDGMMSIGVAYRFGQQEAAQEAITKVSASTETSAMQSKHFTLRSDVLFNFNTSTLKPQGQEVLAQLYNQVHNLDPKDGYIMVLGFTDRIGSEEYNRVLSKKRAQSVVDYLIKKGIPSNKISARGMGASNPLTGSSCANLQDHATLIKCLAPDRRIEIEVLGMRDI